MLEDQEISHQELIAQLHGYAVERDRLDHSFYFAPYSSFTWTFKVAFTSGCNFTGTFVTPNERMPSLHSIFLLSTLIPKFFCKLSEICFVDTEPNRRPPSPAFALISNVMLSNFSFNAFASCSSCAASFSSCLFWASNLLKASFVASTAKPLFIK